MQVIENAAITIKEVWDYQHPVMHSWFVISVISFCIMSAFMFFIV